MKNFIFPFILLFSALVINCNAPISRPEYVGTWKGTAYQYGTSTIFSDMVLTLDETNFEMDFYTNPGGTTIQIGSLKGTHGPLAPNTTASITITFVYTGTWNPPGIVWMTNIQYAISGSSMDFLYDPTDPPTGWTLQATLVKQ